MSCPFAERMHALDAWMDRVDALQLPHSKWLRFYKVYERRWQRLQHVREKLCRACVHAKPEGCLQLDSDSDY